MVKSKGFKLHKTSWGLIIIGVVATVAGGLILYPITSKTTKPEKSNNQSIENSNNNVQVQDNKGIININHKEQFTDQVEIFADAQEYELKLDNGNIQKSWNIRLWNIGKLNLKSTSYNYAGITKKEYEEDLPAGSDKFANFILVPYLGKEKTKLTVYFTDYIGKKYSKAFILEKRNGIPQIHPLTRMLEI